MSKNKGIFDLSRLGRAFFFSWQGLRACYENEPSFRQEAVVLAAAIPLAFLFGDTPLETALLIISILLIMLVELMNSAIEAIIDRFGNDRNEFFGMAKDMGSAAVLVAILISVILWIVAVFF